MLRDDGHGVQHSLQLRLELLPRIRHHRQAHDASGGLGATHGQQRRSRAGGESQP